MTKLHDDFAKAFDMETTPKNSVSKVGNFKVAPAEKPPEPTKLDNDFDFAREKIMSATLTGQDALENLVMLIRDNGEVKPQLFDSVAHLMNAITNSQKTLVDLHNIRKNVVKTTDKTNNSNSGDTINNTLVVGTTDDLDKALENLKKK